MKCSSPLVLLSLLLCAQALRVPQLSSRRAAIGAIGSAILLPTSAQVRKRPVSHVPALMRVCSATRGLSSSPALPPAVSNPGAQPAGHVERGRVQEAQLRL